MSSSANGSITPKRERRRSKIQITNHNLRVDVERKPGRPSTQVIPLSNLSVFGHGEIEKESMSWTRIIFLLIAALIFVGVVGSGGTPLVLLVVGLAAYKLLSQPETGLLLTTNSGYGSLFTSKDYASIAAITDRVFEVLENPAGYADKIINVQFNGGEVNWTFVDGNNDGTISTGTSGGTVVGAHNSGTVVGQNTLGSVDNRVAIGEPIDLTSTDRNLAHTAVPHLPPPPSSLGAPAGPGNPAFNSSPFVAASAQPSVTVGSANSGTVVGSNVGGSISNNVQISDAEYWSIVQNIGKNLNTMLVSIPELGNQVEFRNAAAAVSMHMRNPEELDEISLREYLSRAVPVLKDLAVGAASSGIATETYRLIGRLFGG